MLKEWTKAMNRSHIQTFLRRPSNGCQQLWILILSIRVSSDKFRKPFLFLFGSLEGPEIFQARGEVICDGNLKSTLFFHHHLWSISEHSQNLNNLKSWFLLNSWLISAMRPKSLLQFPDLFIFLPGPGVGRMMPPSQRCPPVTMLGYMVKVFCKCD